MPFLITQYSQLMLVLTTLNCMLLAQLDLEIASLHSVKRLAMSVAVAVMHKSHYLRSHASLAVHAAIAKETENCTKHCIHEAEV